MNNDRRKILADVLEALEELDVTLNDAVTDLESVKDEEQEALDSVSEHFPGSEREDLMTDAVNYLDDAQAAVQQMLDSLDEAKEAIQQASE